MDRRDARLTRALPGRQVLTAGVEFIDNVHQDQQARLRRSGGPAVRHRHDPRSRARSIVQDEIKLGRWLIANGGLRYDRYERLPAGDAARGADCDAIVQSVVQVPVWAGVPRAERVRAEHRSSSGKAPANLRPESIDTHEFVWERYTNDWLRTSVSTYWYKADGLITLTADPSTFFGTTFVNGGQVRASGLELEAQMRLSGGVQGVMSYALQRAKDLDDRRRRSSTRLGRWPSCA